MLRALLSSGLLGTALVSHPRSRSATEMMVRALERSPMDFVIRGFCSQLALQLSDPSFDSGKVCPAPLRPTLLSDSQSHFTASCHPLDVVIQHLLLLGRGH